MDLHIPLPWSITLDSGRRIKLYASFDRVLAFLDVLRGTSARACYSVMLHWTF